MRSLFVPTYNNLVVERVYPDGPDYPVDLISIHSLKRYFLAKDLGKPATFATNKLWAAATSDVFKPIFEQYFADTVDVTFSPSGFEDLVYGMSEGEIEIPKFSNKSIAYLEQAANDLYLPRM